MLDNQISLTPISDLDSSQSSFEAYSSRLDAIFSDHSLRNIAVIGNRGAGKSSILHSYDKQHNNGEEKFLFVSLIDFEQRKSRNPDNMADPEQIQKHLEYSLLCQILARCTNEDLKGSRLKGIPEAKRETVFDFIPVLYLFFTSLLVFILAFHEQFDAAMVALKLENLLPILHALGYLLAFVLVFCGITIFARNNSRRLAFRKLAVKLPGTEAEITPSDDDYCLDQYKFEIIYILNKISKKIGYTVVFEDMERLDSNICVEIMSKLRELNTLLNTHRFECDKKNPPLLSRFRKITGYTLRINISTNFYQTFRLVQTEPPQPVRFIYALSDEVFDSETRAKFYDTILPVIPALNSNNVRSILENMLRECAISADNDYISPLLDILVPELTDYRTVRNIVSEFTFLKDVSINNRGTHLTQADEFAKLLALTVYKVLFPKEFASTYTNAGNTAFPHPEAHNHPPSRIKMVEKLFQNNYLENSSLMMIGYSQKQLLNRRLEILKSGSPQAKRSILNELIREDSEYLRKQIIDSELLFTEDDIDIILLMSAYLNQTPSDCLRSIIPNIIEVNFFHLLRHPIISFIKIKDSLSAHNTSEEVKYTNVHEIKYFINTLLCLTRFPEEAIQEAVKSIGYDRVTKKLLFYITHYSYSAFNFSLAPFSSYPSYWQDSFWQRDGCMDVLLTCLGDKRNTLPKKILNRRFGFKKLKTYIERYNSNHLAPEIQTEGT